MTVVTGIAIFADFGLVAPGSASQERSQTTAITKPNGDVDVGVFACNSPDMEIDCPAAKQPVGQAVLPQQVIELRDRGELRGDTLNV